MTNLMGPNIMRKDGAVHQRERKAIFPKLSPKPVQTVWEAQCKAATQKILTGLALKRTADLVKDFAMPVSGEALKGHNWSHTNDLAGHGSRNLGND